MRIKFDLDLTFLRVNRVIKYFIIADLFLYSGWGMVGPVLSIFVLDEIKGATIVTVGVMTMIYWVIKSLLQLPVAVFLDKHPGEKDDFYALVSGLILAGIAAIGFLLARTTGHLYLVTVVHALAFGLYAPSWSAIFSRHLDKERYAIDWSLNSTALGLAHGVAGLLSGLAVKYFGFGFVFIVASLFSFASAFVLLLVPDLILPKTTSRKPLIRDHSPMTINK